MTQDVIFFVLFYYQTGNKKGASNYEYQKTT